MKIILDANIILEDIRLASNRFTSLFVFMRRTDSTLVVPNLVLEEVLGHHERLLKEKLGKLQRAADDVHKLLFSQESTSSEADGVVMPDIDITEEQQALKDRLFSPASGIRTTSLEESVNLKEAIGVAFCENVQPATKEKNYGTSSCGWLSCNTPKVRKVVWHLFQETTGFGTVQVDSMPT